MKSFVDGILGWLEGWGIATVWLFVAVGFYLIFVLFKSFGLATSGTFSFVLSILPIFLCIAMFLLFHEMWLLYVRKYFDLDADRVTLEIKLPQEVFKSPEAMELALAQIYQVATPDNHVQTYWDGKHPPVYGFEIVSRGGAIKFYLSTPAKKFKHISESQLYAQYPGIEINVLDIDYTAEIPWNPKKYFYFGFHFRLKKPDAYPIKTYFDFGLQAMPKEEEKIDPITALIDAMASIGPGEHIWMQYRAQAHRKQEFKTGSLRAKPDWRGDVQKEIDAIMENAKKRGIPSGDDPVSLTQLTDGERNMISALERSMGKYAFEVNIRAMYIQENGVVSPGERMGLIAGIFREFDDVSKNQIGINWRTDTDWPWWQDIGGKNVLKWKKDDFYWYKRRYMDRFPREQDSTCLLTTEELATLWHLPGKVALTPTLERIPSTRGEAPANLPTK